MQLQELSKWIQDNQQNLPQTMPPPEEVCQDLSAAGHALYLPIKKEPLKSWLVLDLPGILHEVYETLFSQSKGITTGFGLLHCCHLASLFPDLDVELIQQLLVSLEFCIPVDLSILKVEMRKLTQSEETSGWLFFPALISAKPPPPISEDPLQQSGNYLCWQLRTSKKHSISAHVLQTTLLRLVAHFVVQQCNEEGVRQHCCSIWWNGIAWQSKRGVDIAVHITNNRVIQVVGMSNMSADILCYYLSDVISDILLTVHQLSPKLAAAAYIVHPPKLAFLHEAVPNPPPRELFLVEDIQNSIAGHEAYTLSCKDIFGHSTRLPVSDLLGGWNPSLEDIERILWTQSEPSQSQLPNDLSKPTSTAASSTHPPTHSGAAASADPQRPHIAASTNPLLTPTTFALMLGVKDFLIDTVSENHPNDCEGACRGMLNRWLRKNQHTGGEERTWSTLLTALGRADFGELERSLRKEHVYELK